MLKNQYEKGQRDALAKFKLANMAAGAQGYNPMLNGQASTPAPTQVSPALTPPTSAAAPMATGAAKSQVLG